MRVEVINGRKLAFVEAEGTHVSSAAGPQTQRRRDQALRAVVLETSPQETLIVRIIGDKAKAAAAAKTLRAAVIGE